jgi:hypothetical protein
MGKLMNELINELKILNNNINGILEVIKKSQKTKTEQVFDIACASVGILGIITIADIIINWIRG